MNAPVIVFPDVVELVIGAISDGFAEQDLTVTVGNVVPPERPKYFVGARRLGGPRRDFLTDQAQIRLESYAPTAAEAHDNLEVARAYVNAMRGTVRAGWSIGRVDEFAGPQDLPDPVSTSPRYVMTMLIAVRGQSIDR